MENSILTSTKKILGLAEDYTAFDLDVLTCINSAFATLNDIGIGPRAGFAIDDSSATWEDFMGNDPQLNLVKTYVYLFARMVFDPPVTSFALEAMQKQIDEHIWRLREKRESNTVRPSDRDCEVA